jgi:hypothetical protein
MSGLLIVIAAFFILGLFPVVNGIRFAPEGSEDSTGFYYTWRNNRSDIEDVSCVWVTLSSVSSLEYHEGDCSGASAA